MNPQHGELIVYIQGTQVAVTASVRHVVIETDDRPIVQAIYSNEYDLSAVSNLVEELRSLLV